MYINNIEIENFRTFKKAKIDLVHPDQDFDRIELTKPTLPNVNLLLGNNGSGKTTLLKAIALACLGPAVAQSGIYPYRLIRREPGEAHKSTYMAAQRRNTLKGANVKRLDTTREAFISASFFTHAQDRVPSRIDTLESKVSVRRRGDLESFEWRHRDEKSWHPIYSEESDALFFVGYGSTRRVEQKERFDPGSRKSRVFARAQRVQSLFEETYSLIPLNAWLPQYRVGNRAGYEQVVTLINRLMGKGHYEFTGLMEQGEYLFSRGGLMVPFPALSDGYRAYLGWVGDLLYHVCLTCPRGKELVENRGIVMIDEIDLHLHPKWQMDVLPMLAKALPNIQFIVTSHSPLVVGSLDWSNIIVMEQASRQANKLTRFDWAIKGLDADQVLLTSFFGLETTRSSNMALKLKRLTLRARDGDSEAAKQLLQYMSRGSGADK